MILLKLHDGERGDRIVWISVNLALSATSEGRSLVYRAFRWKKERDMSDLIGLIYAGIIATGGLIGYLKAGSTPSLAAGLGFGALAGFSAHTNNNALLLATSTVLTVVMGNRFYNSGKMMPAGMITVLSIGIVIRCLLRTYS